MTYLQVGDERIEINDDGHLAHYQEWSDDVAREMARRDHLDLSDCHWAVIHFLREYYSEYETPPSPRVIINSVGHKLDPLGCNMKKLKQVFPLGGCEQACRLAGLPSAYCHSC